MKTRSLNLKTSILKHTLTGLAEGMGLSVPESLTKANESALEGLTFQQISFLLFYGHKFETNAVSGVIKDMIREWMDLTECDNVAVDTCYTWRNYYHYVILGRNKANGIGGIVKRVAFTRTPQKTTNQAVENVSVK